MRIFMGHCRTTCKCELCAINCRFIPGYLLPEDLDTIPTFHGANLNPFLDWHHQDASFRQFILTNLLASPGALVLKDGRFFRIQTLVPARKDNGWCRFFDGKLCKIHPVAPFGCAFFDAHQKQSESNTISAKGLEIIAGLWEDQPHSLYCQVWNDLHRQDLRAPAPEECRDRMGEELEKIVADTGAEVELEDLQGPGKWGNVCD
jgi:hypothetical protein